MPPEKHWVEINGKHYQVTLWPDGSAAITISWEVPSVADRFSVHPQLTHRWTSVSPHGRLGKKIMAQLRSTLNRSTT